MGFLMSGTQKITNAQLVTAENSVQLMNTLIRTILEARNNSVSLVSLTKTILFLPVSQNSLFLSHSLQTCQHLVGSKKYSLSSLVPSNSFLIQLGVTASTTDKARSSTKPIYYQADKGYIVIL